jgi:hypothetical protein
MPRKHVSQRITKPDQPNWSFHELFIRRAAGALSFAHLVGGGRTEKKHTADDNEDDHKQRDGESGDDYNERMEELDETDGKKKGKPARRKSKRKRSSGRRTNTRCL